MPIGALMFYYLNDEGLEGSSIKWSFKQGLVDLADIHSELVSTLDNSGDIWVKDITN